MCIKHHQEREDWFPFSIWERLGAVLRLSKG